MCVCVCLCVCVCVDTGKLCVTKDDFCDRRADVQEDIMT